MTKELQAARERLEGELKFYVPGKWWMTDDIRTVLTALEEAERTTARRCAEIADSMDAHYGEATGVAYRIRHEFSLEDR